MDPLFECCGQRCSNDWTLRHCQRDDQCLSNIGRGGMGRPELLAGDIGEALVTTATGLTIGIPAMIAYFILRNRLNSLMLLTSQIGTELLAIPLAKKRSPSQ